MKLSEKLLTVASWLESPDNDLLVKAEGNETRLSVVARSLVKAATALKEAAAEVSEMEPGLDAEKLDEMAAVAEAFDQSDDELLQKQASVLDEILLTIAAPKNAVAVLKQAEDDRIEQLKKKYKETKEIQDEVNKVSDAVKKIEDSEVYKKYRPLETPLSARTCPDHPGGLLARVGEHTWQCVMDNKIYNFDMGFKMMNGKSVEGGSVENQTPNYHDQGHTVFDSRDSRLYPERGSQ